MKKDSGAHVEEPNRTAEPYIRPDASKKVQRGNKAHLLPEQGVAPLPGAGTVAAERSLGVANELDLDAPAPASDAALPPRPDSAPDDDAMLRRLAATRGAALRWLAWGGR